jgi:hypothetical protein
VLPTSSVTSLAIFNGGTSSSSERAAPAVL